MATSKQLADIRSTATGLRSALNSAQSSAPRLLAPGEVEASGAEWTDTLDALSRLMDTLGCMLAENGADIDELDLADKLTRFRRLRGCKRRESEHTS